mmetsp:Transcript_2004/g.2981  ORF Transcript_2004/g.2981 Transcript_2004/m.2981 type:complete len:111 (+) Transcript_2004:216-548(+)
MRMFPNSDLFATRKDEKGGLGRNGWTLASSVMNGMPGTLTQSKIRAGADLTPTEGSLVLVQYYEARPHIHFTKGMVSEIVNYYRGERSKCPISAGGGDRPIRKMKHENHE